MILKRIKKYLKKRTIKRLHTEFEILYYYNIPLSLFEVFLIDNIEIRKYNMNIMKLKIRKLNIISKRDVFKMISLEYQRYKRMCL